MNRRGVRVEAVPLVALAAVTAAAAQQPLPWEVPTALQQAILGDGSRTVGTNAAAINEAGGYAIFVETIGPPGPDTASNVWGTARGGHGRPLRQESCFGTLCQTSFGESLGISNAGAVVYTAEVTDERSGESGLDSVWLDDGLLALEGRPVAALPGRVWSGGFEVGMTATGVPYWRGSVAESAGGASVDEGLFWGDGAAMVLGGQDVPGTPYAVATPDAIGSDFDLSARGTHWMAEVWVDAGPAGVLGAVVLDGAVLTVDGGPVYAGAPVPESAGGLPGERWEQFSAVEVNEAGQWLVAGDTDAEAGRDGFLLADGRIVMREGERIGEAELLFEPLGVALSEDGDQAVIWNAEYAVWGTDRDTLFVNGRGVTIEDDTRVDTDGDGLPGSIELSAFRADTLRVMRRQRRDQITVQFQAVLHAFLVGETWSAYMRVLVDPAWSLELEQGTLTRGREVPFEVTGGAPGETVQVLRSFSGRGEGPCPAGLDRVCLDLLAPVELLGEATVGEDGVALLEARLPAELPELEMSTQAVIDRSAQGLQSVKSNTVIDVVRLPDTAEWIELEVEGPPGREDAAMTFDVDRGVVLLYGGLDAIGSPSPDTWQWDGTQWTELSRSGPGVRSGAAMAYDERRGVAVLFGGSPRDDNDTWEWDGLEWTQVAVEGPSARRYHAMAYDSRRGVTLLYGGSVYGCCDQYGDTWAWDGTVWRQVADDASGPPARDRHAMVYDARRDVVVLFGGLGEGELGDDTWEWDGRQWAQVADEGPELQYWHAMAYDAVRGLTVQYGGLGHGRDETWEWDGFRWRQAAVGAANPGYRNGHAMAFDREREETVLFGGSDGSGSVAETWVYRPLE